MQKELGWGFTGQVGYVATRSVRQLAYHRYQCRPGAVHQSGHAAPGTAVRTYSGNHVHPTGRNGSLRLLAGIAAARRFAKGLMLNVNYTWGKAINFVDNSSGTPPISNPSRTSP